MKKKWLPLLLIAVLLAVSTFTVALADKDFALQPEPAGDKVYISDLEYTSYRMEGTFKPWIDTDSSDSGKVNIGKLHAFDKGIRTHPGVDYDAYVTYDISRLNAYKFCAYIGKDYNSTQGKTQFKVYVDDVCVYTSALLEHGQWEYISVDVSGAKVLKLVQNDGGDGYSFDGGSWGDAALYCAQEEGTVIITAPDTDVLVSSNITVGGQAVADQVKIYYGDTLLGTADVEDTAYSVDVTLPDNIPAGETITLRAESIVDGEAAKSVTASYRFRPALLKLSEISFGGTFDSKKVTVNASRYGELKIGSVVIEKGIELPATLGETVSEITYDITGAPYTYFEGFASVVKGAYNGGDGVVFELLADGKVVYRSETVTGAVLMTADIPAGTKTLTMRGVSADIHAQVVVFGDGTLYETASVAGNTKSYRDGASKGDVALAKQFMQVKFTGEANGIVIRPKAPIEGELSVMVYAYERSFRRTVHALSVISTDAYVLREDGSYYIPFAAPLPAGEYLIDFVCDDSVKIDTYASSTAALYTTEEMKSLALDLDLVLTADGDVQSAVPNPDVKYVGNKTTEDEKKRAETMYRGWMKDMSTFPVSMKIGDDSYIGFGQGFAQKSQTVTVDPNNKEIEHTVTVLVHDSGLEFTVTSEYYANYAAFEWMIEFTNPNKGKSPVVSELKALNIDLKGENPIINTSKGDSSQFTPDIRALNGKESFQSVGGRSTQGAFPYYNFEYGNRGLLLAIGWSGNWRADFDNAKNADSTNIQVGQTTFKSYLNQDEVARTPRVAMVLYDGSDLDRAQNLWRRWFIDCSMHRVIDEDTGELELFEPISFGSTSIQFAEMTLATDENQIEAIRKYVENGIKINFWWMDAGWYFDTEGNSLAPGAWTSTGGWHIDTSRFPSKMADISEYGKSVGIKTLLWFEPERVLGTPKTDGSAVHPDWLLKGGWSDVVDLGNPEAVEWLLDRILTTLGDGKISLYREDFNTNPDGNWNTKYQGKINREGMAENEYVQGHLYLWDEILKAYPSAMIDCCASGGLRSDFEALRRSVQLHKTDFDYGASDIQQLYALEMYAWMPFFGTKADSTGHTHHAERYKIRTALVAGTVFGYDSNQPIDWDIVRDIVDERELIDRFNYTDYYKLADYNRDSTAQMGWMFLDHAQENGYGLFFRREKGEATTRYFLRGLKEDTTYHIWFEDRGAHATYTGYELMYNGIDVTIPASRSSDIMYISTTYTEKEVETNINYVSVDGQYGDPVMPTKINNVDYYRFDIRVNMSLRGTILPAGEDVETDVKSDYLASMTLNGKKLSDMAKQVKMDYDAVNNILRVYIKKDNSAGFTTKEDATLTIDDSFMTWEGRKLKPVTYEYHAKTDSWHELGTPIESLTLVSPAKGMLVGEKLLLTAVVNPFDASDNSVTFTSSDIKIASVSQKGYVRARSVGTVTITATANDGSGKTATYTLRVVEKEEDLIETQPPVMTPETGDETQSAPADEGSGMNAGAIVLLIIGVIGILAGAIVYFAAKDFSAKGPMAIILVIVGTVALILGLILPSLSGGSDTPADGSDTTESSAITTQGAEESDAPKTGFIYLTDLEYESFLLAGSDTPFYGQIPHTGEYLDVEGVRYEKGVFINVHKPDTAGSIEYSLIGFDFDRFACKFGKLDVSHGAGDPTFIKVFVDDVEVAVSSARAQGQEADLVIAEIPDGAKTLRIECHTTGASYANCSSVLGDAVLYYDGTELTWP